MTNSFLRRISGPWLAFLLIGLMLVFYLVYATFLSPRPYYVQNLQFDIENDYVYNSKLIVATGTPHHILHPGTPIQYLGAGIMAVVGTGVEKTQIFLNVGYLTILLTIIGSLAIFTRVALSKTAFPIALLALATLVFWPPLLTFMNYWGGEAFVICIGFVAAAMIWPVIDQDRELGTKENIVLGLLIGFGLAIKFSLLPLVFILLATVTAVGIKKRWDNNGRVGGPSSFLRLLFREPILISTSAILMFGLVTSPVLLRSHQFFATVYRLWRIDAQLTSGESATKLMNTLADSAPLTIGITGILLIVITAGLAFSIVRSRTGTPNGIRQVDHTNYSRTGVAAFSLSFIFIGIIYGLNTASLVGSGGDMDPGIKLRELTGLAVVTPILVLCAHRVFAPLVGNFRRVQIDHKVTHVALTALSIGAILFTTISYGTWRANDVDVQKSEIAEVWDKMNDLVADDTRIASGEFWVTGEPYFHFYGNSIYAADYFEDELSSDFERYAFLRWGQLHRERQLASGLGIEDSDVIRNTGILGSLERMYQDWRKRWPGRERSNTVITGEHSLLPISVFVYNDKRARTGRLGDSELEIISTIENLFGEISYVETLDLDTDTWNFVVFEIPE